jgi:rubrerythrin
MVNPIKIYSELKERYLQYIKAGIPLMEDYYEKEREKLYEDDGVIMHPPYIELVKKYEGKKSLSEICGENKINMKVADFLNRGLLHTDDGEERRLYEHQEQAIVDVLKNRKNMVITTGTGSGKTEAFLIPLLADIIEESLTWKQNKKESALRSIIFYPLNALAEDQMTRLRRSLASEDIIKWYEENKITNRITFGRYIGRTPKDKRDSKFREIKYRWDMARQIIDNAQNENWKKKLQTLLYSSPCCGKDSPEIIDRESMQEAPPDILITNYSMLNIMLMRQAEKQIFDKTREWLISNKKNIFTLIIDELHTYRGTAGTEVAYIIKVLLNRLGLSPSSPQVRFLASSASMSVSDESRKYISDFFGTDNTRFSKIFTFITDMPEKKDSLLPLPPLPIEKFDEIADKDAKTITEFVMANKLTEWLVYALKDKMTGNTSVKSAETIKDTLFGNLPEDERKRLLEIFLSLISKAKDNNHSALRPIRAHYFLRNIEKIFICVNKDCDAIALDYKNKNRQYGKIYNQPITRCTCGALVYEAIVCRQCGELFFCGYEYERKLTNIVDIYNPKRPKVLYRPDLTFYPKGEIEGWTNVDFDIKTGIIKPGKNGRFFQHIDTVDYTTELPTTCPRCEFSTKNFKTRNFSALFRHGTGVQKVNQVCADTLMRILAKSEESRKLVIFSDSRQSAAKLAAGIELDHYRDALRQTVLLSFDTYAVLIKCLRKWRNGEINDIPDEYKEAIRNDDYLKGIRRDISDEKNGYSTDSENRGLDKKLSCDNPTLEYIISLIMKNLIKVGLNPAGPYPSVFYVDPVSKDKKWYECVNSSGTGFETDTDQKEKYDRKVYNLCRAEILKIMLGSPKRSFESLGLGYYHVQTTIDNIEPEFLDSMVRIIGESNRIFSNESEEQASLPKRLWKYFGAVKNETTKRHPILDIVKNHFIQNKLLKDENDLRLTGENIVFVPAKIGDNVWECKKCGTKHLHRSAGKCTYCFSDLPQITGKLTEQDLTDTYYTQKRNIDKLHCEELTGQTNTQDALDRQRLFQDILYDKENPDVDNIELLSVTTTMEAGVDIGSLLAIMMGNVPPQRFNYQQRVGRAGRRGSPLSIALTVARANSHDLFHYANPERVVSGDPAPPYLDFLSKEIFTRIVYKEILKRAFSECGISPDNNDSVHGQFGEVSEWTTNKPKIAEWLKNHENISADYDYLIGKFESSEKIEEKRNILKNIRNEMIDNIDRTIIDPDFNQVNLSERLAAGGRLPMFGFPTQIRYLYESKPARLPAEDITDRPMDLALSTFVPGSEIIKDKKVYLSVGFIDYIPKNGRAEPADGLMRYENQALYQCPKCGYAAVRNTNDKIGECPICDHIFDRNKGEICDDICSPKGYCVNFNELAKDFDGNFNWNPVKINARLDSEVTREIALLHVEQSNIKLGNNTIPEKGVVRTINSNDGDLFTIRKTRNNVWIVPDLVKEDKGSPQSERHIALVASKITGIMILALDSENQSVCLNPFFKGNIESINKVRSQLLRSAFLSWGELVRRSVTGFLDIRTGELSVDYFVRKESTDSAPYPAVYMMEQLENGAGYTDYLASLTPLKKCEVFINSLISGGDIYNSLTGKHQEQCDTSCYDCLCDYENLQKHSLLNWRLGLDIAILSRNNNQVPGYTEDNSYWSSVLIKTENIIKKQATDIQLIKEKKHYYTKSKEGIKFIYHPLWSENYILKQSKNFDVQSDNITYISLPEFINNAEGFGKGSSNRNSAFCGKFSASYAPSILS